MSKPATPPPGPDIIAAFEPLTAWNGAVLRNVTEAAQVYAKGGFEFQQEVLRFLGSRLQWDSKVGQALAACKTVGEVAEMQKDWLEETTKEYVDEAGQLFRLGSKLATQWMAPLAAGIQPGSKEPERRQRT